ncbi:MAG: aminotransferase class V-fold PLP-dependent enzyme, partial [bacterium]|nr:aminotransferase class V-fold PLP-dependent enzyme [bacterium]
VPGIVGFGAACEVAASEMEQEAERLQALRDRLEEGILSHIDEVTRNGHPERRLPGTSNLSFAYVEGESLMMGLSEIALSSGSACTSATLEPSYVLRALGVGDELAHSSLRFSLGRFNTESEVDTVIERVRETVERLRALSPLYEMAKEGIDISSVEWQQ